MNQRKLFTFIRGAICMAALGVSGLVSAEPGRSFECLPPSYLPGPMGAGPISGTSCGKASDDYKHFYGRQENYIPENFGEQALYVHKTIRVALHVIQPSYPADYNYKASDEALIKAFINKANFYLSQNDRPSDPMYVGGRDPWILDTRFRLELQSINYNASNLSFEDSYREDLESIFESRGLFKDAANVLNVFVMYSDVNTIPGGVTMFHAGVPFIVLKNFYRDLSFRNSPEHCASVLLHELGHAFGLNHVYNLDYGNPAPIPERVDETDSDYLEDVFGSAATGNKFNWRPYDNAAYPAPPNQFGVDGDALTNNFMGGHPYGHYYSPQQLGRMHRNAHLDRCRNFLYNTYPEDDNHDHTGQGQRTPLVISKNEDWDFEMKMYSDIVVRKGATLTIHCTLHMPYLSNIIVEPGAKLVVDGGTITSGTAGDFWYGISVLGTRGMPQDLPGYQGIVETKNGAVISNALHAITAGDEVYKDYAKCGGIIRAIDTRFYNNKHSIAFWSYENSLGPLLRKPNRSYIRNCRFELDDNYPYDKDDKPNRKPIHQLTAWEVRGIEISGCSFENKMSTDKRLRIGGENSDGIVSFEANIGLDEYCAPGCARPTPMLIKGFANGLRADAVVSRPFSVHNTSFVGNGNGILMSGITGADISHNKFDVLTEPTLTLGYCQGIQAYGCNAYQIAYNDFGASTMAGYNALNIGVRIIESGSDANKVNHNTFNLWTGAMAQGLNTNGNNWDEEENTGLIFRCNTFERYSAGTLFNADIRVKGEDASVDGIRFTQGSNVRPAGNSFKPARSAYPVSSHFFIDNAQGLRYYFNNLDPATQKPTAIDPLKIETIGRPIDAECNGPDIMVIGGIRATTTFGGLQSAFTDSLGTQGGDPVIAAYRGMASAYGDAELSLYLLSQGQIAQGLSLYNSILSGNIYKLNRKEEYEFALGGELVQLAAQQYQGGRTMMDLDAGAAEKLRSIRTRSQMWPGAKACAWLHFALNEDCGPAVLSLPEAWGSTERLVVADNQPALKIIPNPVQDACTIQYQLEADAECVISDLSGRARLQCRLDASQNSHSVNMRDWPAGIYLYRVIRGGQSLYYGKLVKY